MANANITAFDKTSLGALRKEIDAALAGIGEKYGISLVAGNASYMHDGSSATFKLECSLGDGKDRGDIRHEKYAQAFERYNCLFPNLNLTDIYVIGRKEYKIAGYNSRAREYPLILVDQKTGQGYKFDVDTVKRATVKK